MKGNGKQKGITFGAFMQDEDDAFDRRDTKDSSADVDLEGLRLLNNSLAVQEVEFSLHQDNAKSQHPEPASNSTSLAKPFRLQAPISKLPYEIETYHSLIQPLNNKTLKGTNDNLEEIRLKLATYRPDMKGSMGTS